MWYRQFFKMIIKLRLLADNWNQMWIKSAEWIKIFTGGRKEVLGIGVIKLK
jgi:hypothetical protein